METVDLLIRDALIVNEGASFRGWLAVADERIAAIGVGDVPAEVVASARSVEDAAGKTLLPGVIDEHVHTRDPGLTEKGDMASESAAAAAGGVTSIIDMPNTRPATTTLAALEAKEQRAAAVATANYAFYLGATNTNLDELLQADYSRVAGVKVFLGSSTGNMLVDRRTALDDIFGRVDALIAVHAEDEAEIARCRAAVAASGNLSIARHPDIRTRRACLLATQRAIELAKVHGSRLHVLHVSTAEEALLFEPGDVAAKRITAETCPQYLLFSSADYARLGARIKCNPAVKDDREALLTAIAEGRIDTIATDHAPHLLSDKAGDVLTAASGMPMLQFSLPAMLTMLGAERAAELMAHNPARLYGIADRGFLRPGAYADLVLAERRRHTVSDADVVSRCGWTPLAGATLDWAVASTWLNGRRVFDGTKVDTEVRGRALRFDR